MSLKIENENFQSDAKMKKIQTDKRPQKTGVVSEPEHVTVDDSTVFASPTDYQDEFKEGHGKFSINPISAIFLAIHIHGYFYVLFQSYEQFFLAIVPTVLLLPFMIWWYKNKFHCSFYEVTSCYADGLCALGLTSLILKLFYFCNRQLGIDHALDFIHPYMSHAFFHVIIGEILKCYAFTRNINNKRFKKAKRTMIVSIIIALGFSFGESIHLVHAFFGIVEQNPTFNHIVGFMTITILIGQPLHLVCGYLCGVLNTINNAAPYDSLWFTIPARAAFMVCAAKLVWMNTFEDFVVTLIVGLSGILFLLYLTHIFAKDIPNIATKNYMSLLDYDDDEEEGFVQGVSPHFTIE